MHREIPQTKFTSFQVGRMMHDRLFMPCVFFRDIKGQIHLLKYNLVNLRHKSFRSDQYESKDSKSGSIPTNLSCGIATQNARVKCAARLGFPIPARLY
jgi:hypothetical protein